MIILFLFESLNEQEHMADRIHAKICFPPMSALVRQFRTLFPFPWSSA